MKGWRTLIVAVVTAVIGALEAFDFTNIITGSNAPFIISGLGVVFAWLRKITNTEIGNRTAEEKTPIGGGGGTPVGKKTK